MIARAWKLHIRPTYVLADSWYLSEKRLRGVLEIGNGALHFLGMAKMGSTKYKVEGRLLDAASLTSKIRENTASLMQEIPFPRWESNIPDIGTLGFR